MARNQIWDSEGNLIEDIEAPDEVIEVNPTIEELTATVAELTAKLNEKGLIP